MPTVATKNGGPVDIMATLHHGLLVDPTNSKQIADALIKILTNAQVWDEMSQNGAHFHCSFGSGCTEVLAVKLIMMLIRLLGGSLGSHRYVQLLLLVIC